MTGVVERYEAALHEKIDSSSLPILIYNPGATEGRGDFWDRFPADQRFQSFPNRGALCGYETHTSFNRLLREREVLGGVVHGSYLEQCVRGFKASLSAFGKTGILYVRSPVEIGYIDDSRNPQTVTYGLVLRDGSKPTRPLPEFQNIGSNLSPHYYAEDAQVYHA